MLKLISDEPPISYFIEDWVISMGLKYNKDIPIPKAGAKIDFLLSNIELGILIVDWEKPISVKIINRAFKAMESFELEKIVIVCKRISEVALSTLKKLPFKINIIHPFGLTDLAILLMNLKQKYQSSLLPPISV